MVSEIAIGKIRVEKSETVKSGATGADEPCVCTMGDRQLRGRGTAGTDFV